MNKSVVTKYQPSITEWFESIGEIQESKIFRLEDNLKHDRLEILYQTIGLEYERPESFSAQDLYDKRSNFFKTLKNRGNELCAIRLVPKRADLPKLRSRGLSIKDTYYNWFLTQNIQPEEYIAQLCPHSETLLWSAIFVVNRETIFGEIVKGLHSQLTHGDTKNPVYQFCYDYKSWQWSKINSGAVKQVKKMVKSLLILDSSKRKNLMKKLNAQFYNKYLMGYFETTVWPDKKIRFIDYNRILPKYIPTFPLLNQPISKKDNLIAGISACSGVVRGKVILIDAQNLGKIDFPTGSILVCDNTDVRYLSYMKRASAIITNRGGLLSHAAIIARELAKPCIIGTKIATKILKDGDYVEVDADEGIVRKIIRKQP